MKKINMRLEDAIRTFGSKRKVAKAVGIDPRSVSDWKEIIPELRAYQIVEIVKQQKK
jgi:hypothetical protein